MLGDIDTSALVNFETPPDILQHCTQSLTRELKRFPIPSTLDVNGLGTSRPFANLEIICDVYSNISGNTAGLALFKAHETISKIFGRGLPASWIHSLSHGVGDLFWRLYGFVRIILESHGRRNCTSLLGGRIMLPRPLDPPMTNCRL
jgi:hypothetical protein